jgi:hypothetical protein
MLGRSRGGTLPPASSDMAVIEVKGLVLGGEIIVRTPPRSRRFRLFGGRRRPISRSLSMPTCGPAQSTPAQSNLTDE